MCELLNCMHGGVVAVGEHLFGANQTGRWVCLAFEDGTVRYQERGVGSGSIISAEGLLYCYGEKGTVALVKPTTQAHELVSSFKVDGGKGPQWAHPVISGKRLYLRHGDVLMAYDLAGK